MKLFSGSAHEQLVQEICTLLHITQGISETTRFGNSEIRVRINENVKDETCVVIQPTANPTDTHLIELLFFADALKRGGARKIIGVIPYFGYARQNIAHRSGEAISANVVIRMLEAIGFDHVMCFDLHDEATAGIFSIPFTHLSTLPLLAKHLKKKLGDKPTTILSPDQGGIERARHLAEAYFEKKDVDIVMVEKNRDQDVIHKAAALELYGDVSNKSVILVDDIVTSGSTILPAIDLCLSRGAIDVYAAIAHHDLADDAAEKIQSSKLAHFLTTNTIPLQKNQTFDKLEEISIAPLIAEELKEL